MITLNLHGKLGNALGFDSIELNADSVADALQALEIQTKKLLPVLQELEDKFQVAYELVINGKVQPYEQDLHRRLPSDEHFDVDLIPVICAGKSNWGRVIIGIIIIVVVAWATGGLGFGAGGGSGGGLVGTGASTTSATGTTSALGGSIGTAGNYAWVGQGLSMIGVSLVLSGVSGMLVKPPSAGAITEGQASESYLFSGSFNRLSQGGPIPVLLGGPLQIGSQVINGFADITQVTSEDFGTYGVDYYATYANFKEYDAILAAYDPADYDLIDWNYRGSGTAPHKSAGYGFDWEEYDD